MTTVYDVIDIIKDHFENNNFTNTVSFGSISRADLNKTTMFPIAHFYLNNATVKGNVIEFSLIVNCLDIVNVHKTEDTSFYGKSNEQDIYNTQLQALLDLIKQLEAARGDLAESQFVLTNEPECELIYDEEDNVLAGWATVIDIQVPNTMSIC